MANHKSALKDIRQSAKRRMRNKEALSRMRTFVKKARVAANGTDLDAAQSAFREAVSEVAKAGRKGVVHRNQVARRISRMNAAVKALALSNSPAS